jgi:hypothetical protein
VRTPTNVESFRCGSMKRTKFDNPGKENVSPQLPGFCDVGRFSVAKLETLV